MSNTPEGLEFLFSLLSSSAFIKHHSLLQQNLNSWLDKVKEYKEAGESVSEQVNELTSLLDDISFNTTHALGLDIEMIHLSISVPFLINGLVKLKKQEDPAKKVVIKLPGKIQVNILNPFATTPFDRLCFSPTFKHCNDSSARFTYLYPGSHFSATKNKTSWKWYHHPTTLLREIYQSSRKDLRGALIMDHFIDKDKDKAGSLKLLRESASLCKLVNSLPLPLGKDLVQKALTKFETKDHPLCFPVWGLEKLDHLNEQHGVECPLDSASCSICHEITVWEQLQDWYTNVFYSAYTFREEVNEFGPKMQAKNEKQCIVMADGTMEPSSVMRQKALVIFGPRGSGKTKFFQSFCGLDGHRIIHVKNRFHKSQWTYIDDAWLILIDDFRYCPKRDIETFKSILAAEPTIVEDKWLSFAYKGGVPCVVLCNDEKFFNQMKTDPLFRDDCTFLDVGNVFLGPPDRVPQKGNIGEDGSAYQVLKKRIKYT